MTEKQLNQQVADRICRDLKFDGQAFRLGQYVSLLDGQVVSVADSADEALKALRTQDPSPQRGMLVEVAPPVIDVIR